MALWRQDDQDAQTETVDDALETRAATAPKNRPTPTRQQAEAARMAARHPKLTRKEVRANDRALENQRQVERMEAVDNRPERRLMRDYVDSRWTLLEMMWGVLLVLLATSLLGGQFPLLVVIVTYVVWVVLVACIINFMMSWRGFTRELRERYPGVSSKGLMIPMVSRMAVFRALRQPKPVVKRGEEY